MQRKADLSGSEYVFVVETCQNCKDHHWNTRHDESKYEDFFNKISSAIISRIPNAVVLRNQIPKAYVQYDLYCNLVPNEDDNSPIYDWVPRTGSFEVSYKGMLIFSKLQSSFWPNTQLVGEKCYLLVQDEKDSKDLTRYLAGNSPAKGASKSRAGPQTSKSPIRGYNDSNTGFSGANSNKNMGSPAKQESQKFSNMQNVPARTQSTPNQAQQQQKAAEEQKQREENERRERELKEQQLREQQQREHELREQQEREQRLREQQQKEAEAKKAEQERLKREQEEKERHQREEKERQLREQQENEERERQEQEQAAAQNLNKSHVSHQSDPKFLDHSQSRHDTIPAQASIHRQGTEDQYANEFEEPEPNEVAPEEDIEVGAHLKTPDDLYGYPVFPPGTHSLLKKFMTRELWNNSKNLVDSHGYTFKHAIFTGCKNVDSHIGVIAGSHDSYNAFAELFDQIIEDYHGHKKEAVHHSDMDFTKLKCPPFTPKEQKLIKSTRIRVGRNLAEYPLGPGVSKEQRVEIEQKVVKALSSFEGELAGKFYSLGSLSEDEKKQLIADHFLFKEGDRFQEASFLNRDWPEGRGIFHNDSKTFLVWVNEEDQLRIISMQNGADIGAVFTRLSKACAHIETVSKFAHDNHLGYITSCPTNLGTGLRASVHVYLPNLGQRKEEFQAIADKYHVQIRGAHGEHTETNDHIYDISNKRRLGISEVDLVQDMYNGVKALLTKELEIKPKKDILDLEVGSHLKTHKDLKGFPIFPAGTKSLLSKYLTRELYEQLHKAQDKHGFLFKQAIFSGCQNTDSGIGVYAGSHDSYTAFASFFDHIIQDYHGHGKDAKHVSDMDYKKLNCPPLAESDAKMIKSTRIRVGRNLADYPLGPGLTQQQRKEIEQKVTQALSSFEGELAGKYYALSALSDEDRNKLIADHFLFKEGDRFLEAVGLNRDWPDGRGIFHNNEKSFLVWVNEEDQLRIISMQNGADIGAVFTRLSKACAHIETVAKFSHDDHLGYITSCPTNLGTALRASVHIHLPYLGQHKAEFQAIADKYHVQIRGAHGEHTETDDHIYDISNKRRLGRSEVDLVQDMYNGVKAMIEKEKELAPKKEKVEKNTQCGPQLASPEDVTGFPIFPEGTKSLLMKHLSQDVWKQLKKTKDAHGFTFKQAIFSGCKNTDSGIGLYAGSHDSYHAFAPLFDQVIETYHGHGKDAKHVSDMDYTKLNCPPLTNKEAKLIKSTRIRVGRNLADYPLGPGLTKEQRNEIEQKVTQALSSFEGELAGKYYALSSLSDDERKQLIADHFLFKEGDRFLEAVGLNRDWPEGRGIFHNNEKTFLVWVNEEDQLRIISMQNGADIKAVFTRLSKACAHIETVAKFSHDEHLGYITSCPTNLGTALRASVHIHLPNLGNLKDDFQAIADKYHVQIRGAHGEHTETDDHIYDISNKRRLGRSEVDLVQDMYNGVKAMIQKEIELAPAKEPKEVQAGSHLKSAEDLTGFPIFPAGTKSLLSKYLTRDLWKQLKNLKDKYGFSFKNAIISGSQNVDSGIGVYAGSHDSYVTFAPFFDHIVQDYHGHAKDAKHVSDMDYTKLECPPLRNSEAKLIKSTRIRVGRNLADYPLGPGLTREQRNEIEQKVTQALQSFDGELEGKYYALSALSDEERKQLIADHFLFKEGDRFLEAVGLNRDWPEGRGIYHNNDKTFLVWVNEEDQLRIISMQNGADIGAVFTRLSKACAHIETVAKFAHDDHLGYITSCPTNLGTALRASVHIHLPHLGQYKDEFQAIADQFHVQIRGAHGEHTETDDHIYDISNKRRLGRSEVDLVQDMYNGVKAMIAREKALRPPKVKPEVAEQINVEENKQQAEKLIQCGPHLGSAVELKGKALVFPPGTKSLLSKFCTKEVWLANKKKKDSFGFSFKQAVFSGCKNVDSGIGVYAGSQDSYNAFSDLFNKIIQEYHGYDPSSKHVSDMDSTKLECPPLFEEGDAENMIVSTRIRVGRNLADYPLGPGLTKEQRVEIEEKVADALQSFEGDLQGKYYSLGSLSEEDRQKLIDEHFLFKEGDRFLEAAGLNREWPEGRGIFHNDQKTFLVWVNEEDQLRIISMQKGCDIGAVFERLARACSHIEKTVKFAHSENLGYITSCPTNLGTALRASVHIRLPKLSQHMEEFEAIANKYHVQIRGIHGEHSETVDSVYDISNKRRLGLSEVSLVQDMYNGVKALIEKEKSL